METKMKTQKQLEEMYRDLMGCKCIKVERGCVQQFVSYCYDKHDQGAPYRTAATDDGHFYVYID